MTIKFMVKGRREGKTTSIIEALRWTKNSILVVHDIREARRIEHEFPWMKGRVYSWNQTEALKGLDKDICIDNLDLFLQSLFPDKSVKAVTATGELIE